MTKTNRRYSSNDEPRHTHKICNTLSISHLTVGIDIAYFHGGGIMDLRIDKKCESENLLIWLSGRIRSEGLSALKEEVVSAGERLVIDMREVTLVDVDVVRFLVECESNGVTLCHCPAYIREWISRERKAA